MREHLVYCLENGKMTPFPRENKKSWSAAFGDTPRCIIVNAFCVCEMPDNMVFCEKSGTIKNVWETEVRDDRH